MLPHASHRRCDGNTAGIPPAAAAWLPYSKRRHTAAVSHAVIALAAGTQGTLAKTAQGTLSLCIRQPSSAPAQSPVHCSNNFLHRDRPILVGVAWAAPGNFGNTHSHVDHSDELIDRNSGVTVAVPHAG